MGKTALLIVFFYLLCIPDLIGQNYIRTSSFLFSFPAGSDLLEEDCGDNRAVLLQMEEELSAVRSKIEAGNYHLLVVSHVSAFNYSNLRVINKASQQASYLRAYIISKLSIPKECIAFYIDRSGDYRDKVHIYLVRSELPVYANKEICFSEDESPEAIQKAASHYGGVPYMNLYRKGEVDDYRLAIPIQQRKESVPSVVVAKTTPAVKAVAQTASVEEKQPVCKTSQEPSVKPQLIHKQLAVPRFGISTNLLYWAALTPNLTLDGYFGNAFSVHIEGLYADWQTKGTNPKTWSVWQVSPELRYWLWRKDYRFTGHYLGVYGHLGDFDFMFNNAHGFVGSYEGGFLLSYICYVFR